MPERRRLPARRRARSPAELVFRALVVDRTEDLACIDAGTKKDRLKDLLVAQIQRIPPRRREDRGVIAVEDPELLAGHRATDQPQRVAEERERIALEGDPVALCPALEVAAHVPALLGETVGEEFPVAFSTAPRSIGR
jgi:hypothetical protein